MTERAQKRLTLLAVAGFACWFCGNLYEAVVFSPNWVLESPTQMTRLNEFFIRTSPTHYFIPLTPLAALLTWFLTARNPHSELRRPYRLASTFAVLSVAVNTTIVATLIPHLFGEARTRDATVALYCWLWNAGNVLRIAVVGVTTYHLFQAFLIQERRSSHGAA